MAQSQFLVHSVEKGNVLKFKNSKIQKTGNGFFSLFFFETNAK